MIKYTFRAPAPIPIRTPAKTFWSLAMTVKPPYTPPITPTSKATKIGLCPLGSYLLTGPLLQYAYKFNQLTLLESKYSIESSEIHPHNSGE